MAVTSESRRRDVVHFAARGSTHFDVILAAFCVILVVSNIVATKGIEFGSGDVTLGPIQIWPIITDGGAFLFPFAYVLGDVISEVYGMRAARRAIITGFALAVLTALTFVVVQHAPGASFYENQAAYEAVLGFVPQIVLASLAGYLTGQFLNAFVLVRMKQRTAERGLFARLASSTGIGEAADTLIFCAIAASAIGITTMGQFWNYAVVGFVYKVAVELIVMPLTIMVIGWLKSREPTYWSSGEPVAAGTGEPPAGQDRDA
ncbi:hypothetical protein CLV56_0129 [Mumia flava]|uniref:Probable queuosine precursor transporter n=1 Tax=Mumia flava TaxID=1348852 RepID=A0A2M9BD99_9ACTN|nr:queuosine precursor transporter [Mumia flava]PJJ55926.1 hypothetical protein CLV56_0129 [Mumia flava]